MVYIPDTMVTPLIVIPVLSPSLPIMVPLMVVLMVPLMVHNRGDIVLTRWYPH